MNKKLIIGVLIVCLMAFVAIMAFSQSNTIVRWEYIWITTNIQRANELGQEGWEMVGLGLNNNTGDAMMVLKRRVQ